MGLFGLTLKKIENFGDSALDSLFGDDKPQTQPQAPAPSFTPPKAPSFLTGGGVQAAPRPQSAPQNSPPPPPTPVKPPVMPPPIITPPSKSKTSFTTPFGQSGDITNLKPANTAPAATDTSSPTEKAIGDVLGTVASGVINFPKNLINTAVTDPIREVAATTTHNQVALKNAQTAAANDNPFTPVGQFAKSVAVAATTPAAETEAQKQADYARKVMGDHTGDPVHDAQVDAYANAVQNQLLNEHMNRGGFDQNTKTSDIVKDVGGQALGTVGALTMGDVANAGKAMDNSQAHLIVQSGKIGDVAKVIAQNPGADFRTTGQKILDRIQSSGSDLSDNVFLKPQGPTPEVTPEITPTERTVPTTKPTAQPTATPVETTVKPPQANTGIPAIDKAIDAVHQLYNRTADYGGTIDNTLEMVRNQERLGTRQSARLGAVIRKNLTSEENRAVDDFLDGHPTKDLTPKALKVANALRPLHEQGFNVRQAIKPDVGHVGNYSPRIAKETLTRAIGNSIDSVKQKVNSMYNLNLESGMSEHRNIDKFTGPNGQHIGTAKELGLTQQGTSARYVDAQGNHFIRTHASKQELEDNGFGPYVRSASGTTHLYHSDTLGLKAKADAIDALKSDPNSHGLYTKEQVESGAAPADVRPITGVKGLEEVYATNKDAHTLQKTLGFDGKVTPLSIRALDTAEHAVTQAIVLNPWFHGANQIVQTAIAAGNLPGLKGLPGHGIPSTIYHIATVGKDDLAAVINAGAGGSDYGAGKTGLLSEATHGLTKINAKTMAAIELRLRAGLFKASKEAGMTDKAAADNINKFLGSTKHVNEIAQRAFIFAHYFRTMTGAIGEQVSHPIAQRGSIANTAFVAGLLTAGAYGWAKFTGNPNASIRYPGEVGLIKEVGTAGIKAVKGDPSGAVSLVSNRVNPIIKETGQQAFNKDLFTGKAVDQTPNVKAGNHTIIPGGRTGHAIESLFAPSTQVTQAAEGKRSGWEIAANELGLKTPHASGNVATTNPNLSFLNTPGATENKQPGTNDPTGYSQQQRAIEFEKKMQGQLANNPNALNAYNTLKNYNKNAPGTKFTPTTTPDQEEAAKQAKVNTLINLSKDPAALQAYVSYMTYDKTPDGKIALRSPQETASAWGQLAAHPSALDAIQKQEQANPQHNPQWDITGNGVDGNNKVAPKMYVFSLYKSLSPKDPQRTVILQNNPWISDVENKVANYITSLPKGDAVAGKDYIQYPTTDPAVQSKLDEIKAITAVPGANRTTEQIDRLSTLESDPAVRNTYATKEAYDAAVRNNWGLPPTTSTTTNDGGVGTITTLAKAYGLDPKAVLSVAAHEGLSGGVGDNGTSFGPFQLHAGGALPQSVWAQGADYAHKWAWSPAGIEYAISTMANAGAKGKTGTDAISAITNNFERPADPNGEINAAVGFYNNPDQIQQIAGNSTSIYSPQVAEFAKEYQAATKETRNFMRAQNPDLYTAMQEYMTQADMTTAERGMADAYYGADPSSSTLGAVYNLGTYDIAKNKADNGVNVYSMPPPSVTGYNSKTGAPEIGVAGSSSQTSSAAFTKYANQVKAASQARDAEHAAKAEKGLIKQAQRAAKLRGPKPMTIHMPDQTNVTPYRIKGATLAPRRVNKVALKPQNTLKISNHAKLKT